MAIDLSNLNPVSPGFFWADQPQGAAISPSEVANRNAIALAMARQNRPFPKTLGEGLTALGEAIGQRRAFNQALAQTRALRQYQAGQLATQPPPGDVPPPVVKTPPTAAPAPQSSAEPMTQEAGSADDTTDPDTGRDNVALALASPTAPGVPQANPTEPGPQAPDTATPSSGGGGPAASSPDDDMMVARQNAIASLETGGRQNPYQVVGVPTNYRDGSVDRPYGRYQVMGKNVPAWTKAALGQAMTPAQFLADPDAQDAVFNHRFGGYVAKYGDEGAARAWFGGPRGMTHVNATDVLGTRLGDYGKKYMALLNGGGGDGGGDSTRQQPVQVASLDPNAGIDAVAASDAASNPPIPTGIPAATQVAQAGPVAGDYGGPPPDVTAPRDPGAPPPAAMQFPYKDIAKPVPPQPPPLTPGQVWAMRVIQMNPDDPAMMQAARTRLEMENAVWNKQWQALQEQYKADSQLYQQDQLKRQEWARTGGLAQREGELKLQQAQEAAARQQRFGNLPDSVIQDQLKSTREAASTLPASVYALANAKRLLDEGNLITGAGASQKLDMAKVALSLGLPASQDAVTNTEQVRNYLLGELGQARKAIIGGSRVTQQEMQMIQKAVSDPSLEASTLKQIIDGLQKANRQTAIAYHQNLYNYAADNPNARATLTAQALPMDVMEGVVAKEHLDKLINNRTNPTAAVNFDKFYRTPGLAQYILGHHPAQQPQQ